MISDPRYIKKLADKKILPLYSSLDRPVSPGEYSISGLLKNEGGKLILLNYAQIISLHVKPLSNFVFCRSEELRDALIVGLLGSDLRTTYDQAWSTSQLPNWMAKEKGRVETDSFLRNAGDEIFPEQLIEYACSKGLHDIVFTYSEPVVNLDYILDVVVASRKSGIRLHLVTNGFMTTEIREDILQADLNLLFKLPSSEDQFFLKHCKTRVGPLKENICWFHSHSTPIQIETLLIPEENTSPGQLRNIAQFIQSIDVEVPWILRRFYPAYRILDKNLTTDELLQSAESLGKEAGLKNIQIITER
ncbi:radical SAM protein [Candidatus Dojkabacteria bacterium]|uniref:Radical SAM protein n=1 Tax=Candidatus Dojkabacteria bacterium TaxID=2099670 RepID=A0A955KWN9_9BACT|nr:radical SAM protein [Candidatus Dojkabacteria bacterium]MCB9790499.1 radical SAM protein [Candidatus Nomurabacteria bacterium]